MKKIILLIILFYSAFAYTQIIAYDSQHTYRNYGSQCVDLNKSIPDIVGHQNNVSIKFYNSNSDATNETNELNRFYNPTSNPQLIYARVNSNLDSDFDISTVTISWSTAFPPPGISPCSFSICDTDNNGSEIVYLDQIQCDSNVLVYDNSFCNSTDLEIETTYYLTQTDADNKANAISNNYLIFGNTNIFIRYENTTSNQYVVQNELTINLTTCSTDTDSDGIPDDAEDPNNNLITNDDTDNDGIINRLDNDDDGDGILTIDEDHNGDGNPANNDSNSNGIADYLEQNITLSVNTFNSDTIFNLYPNPTEQNDVFITTHTTSEISVFSITGKLVIKNIISKANKATKINLSNLNAGIYFVAISTNNQKEIKKLIIK